MIQNVAQQLWCIVSNIFDTQTQLGDSIDSIGKFWPPSKKNCALSKKVKRIVCLMLLFQQLAGVCGSLEMICAFGKLGSRVAAMAQSWIILCKTEYHPVLKDMTVEGEDCGDSRKGIYVATGLTPAWDLHWTQDLSKKLIFGLSGCPLFKEVQAFQG
jgi:hypothetical protein